MELNPDLIISANSDPELYEKLSKIAPTVILPYETYRGVHEEVEDSAQSLARKKKQKNGLPVLMKNRSAAHKSERCVRRGETFSIFGAFGKTFYLYGDGIYRGAWPSIRNSS